MFKVIKCINNNTNLWLIFLLTLLFSCIFLWMCEYDHIVLLNNQKYTHMWSLITYLPYFLFVYECKQYSYENRKLIFRSVSNIIQIPSFIILAISLAILLNPPVLHLTSSLFFYSSVDNVFVGIVLTAASYILNYVINKRSKTLLMRHKPQKYTVIPM